MLSLLSVTGLLYSTPTSVTGLLLPSFLRISSCLSHHLCSRSHRVHREFVRSSIGPFWIVDVTWTVLTLDPHPDATITVVNHNSRLSSRSKRW